MKGSRKRLAARLPWAGAAALFLLTGCQEPAATNPAAAGNRGEPLESLFSPAPPPPAGTPTVARNDPAAPEQHPPAPAPLNTQAVDKLIEDNISLREEIRRLRIERENLIRLLRAMGETYDPVDPDKKEK